MSRLITWDWVETSSALDRLVAHEQPWLQRQGPCDRDALALPAGEFVRLAREHVRTEPDLGQELHHPLLPLGSAHRGVDGQGLADDVGDALPRVERRIGILEDNLHRLAVPAKCRSAQRT